MPYRIVVRGPAELHDDEFAPIDDPDKLEAVGGLVGGGKERMSDYFEGDEPLSGIGLAGGDIRLMRDPDGGLEVVTEYTSPRELSAEELSALVAFTEGQWSDGMGVHGFYEALDRLAIEGLNVSCKPIGSKGMTRVEQVQTQ